MSEEDPRIEGLGDRTLQIKHDRRKERKNAAAALIAGLLIFAVGGTVCFIFFLRQNQAIDQLATSVDTLRGQQEYCSRPTVKKSDPKCQEPAAPPAKEIIGQQGIPGNQGNQGPQGIQGIQGPPGIQGRQGLPGNSPACLLEPSRCIGASGSEGKPGAASTVPGPDGKEGKPGADSTVPGPDGKEGKPGADSTVPGPDGKEGKPGADSTVPGPPGADTFPFSFQFTFMDALMQPVTMKCTIVAEAQPADCVQS